MKQTLQKVEYYTSTVYLQKENIGDSKSAIKLIENITEKPQWFNADGTPMQKGAGIDSMMKGYKKGDNGTEMRKPTIGDTVSIQVWAWHEPEQQIQGRQVRKFLITENGFKEYNFSDGGFI